MQHAGGGLVANQLEILSRVLWLEVVLSAPKSHHSLRLWLRFLPPPVQWRLLRFHDAQFPCDQKSLANGRLIPAAESPTITELVVKIASEWRCVILVHSGLVLLVGVVSAL